MMNDPDILEAYAALMDTTLSAIGLYLTAVSGYLITAYLAGNRLTSSQFYIISSLFVVFAVVFSFVGFAIGERAIALEISHEGARGALDWSNHLILGAEILGILASLKFMTDVRSKER